MRYPAMVLFFILSAALSSAAVAKLDGDPASLRIIDVSATDSSRETLYAAFQVIDDLGEILVARPADSDRTALHKLGIPSHVVNVPTGAAGLYVVSLRVRTWQELAAKVAILYVHGDIAIAAAGPEDIGAIERPVPHYGIEKGYRPLGREVVKAGRFDAGGSPKPARGADPRIAAMVAQVGAANLQDMVQDMQDMGQRKAGSGDAVAETYLVNAFNAVGGLNVSTHNFSGTYADNVIAELPGTVDPSIIYVIGGHYDSTSYSGGAPGADDNASGTAGVVEIARILSQYQFKYTIRFACFNAEELGLVGSDAYCDSLVAWGDDVQGMINLDMTCYRAAGDAYDVDFVTNYSSTELINFCIDNYHTYVPTLGTTQGSLSGGTSDHQSFTQHGFAACFPFEDLDHYSPYIHTSNDVIGTSANDFSLARMITQGALASLASLASPVDLAIEHTPLQDTTDAAGPYTVTADVSSLIGTDVTRATLYYDIGSGFTPKDMVRTAGGSYLSSIPGLFGSGQAKYYIEAEDDEGNTEILPEGIGAGHFEFFVGYFNDAFADDFEISDNGWTHGGTGQDDWMRGVPTGAGGYDPATAFSGTRIWGNDLGPSGYNGNYGANANNWLQSPAIDCSGLTGVTLRYRRWLTVEKGQYDQARILVNGNVVFSNDNSTDHIDTEWMLHEIDISAYADNNSSVTIRFTLTTDSAVEYGGWNIDDLHVGTTSDGDLPNLYRSEVYVAASTGGEVDLTINGPLAAAGRKYTMLLSGSGTSPGTPVGSVVVPLNRDNYTDFCLEHLNGAVFQNFNGTLDAGGDAVGTFSPGVITNPNLIGKTFHFAAFTRNPIDYTTDAVALKIVP